MFEFAGLTHEQLQFHDDALIVAERLSKIRAVLSTSGTPKGLNNWRQGVPAMVYRLSEFCPFRVSRHEIRLSRFIEKFVVLPRYRSPRSIPVRGRACFFPVRP